MPESGQKELPKGGLPQPLEARNAVKPPTSETPLNNFERQLFSKGTLDFNLERYVAEGNESLARRREWYGQGGWDERRAAESFADDLKDAHYDLIWKQRFSGKVPKRWVIWQNIMENFHQAWAQKILLSPNLVDAAVSHPNHKVANYVGKLRRLDVRQMTWLFVRPDFPQWNRDQIIFAQKQMGATDEDIQKAQRMADEILKHKQEKGPEDASLESPLLQISSDKDKK